MLSELELPRAATFMQRKRRSNDFDDSYLAALDKKASPKSPHFTPHMSHMGHSRPRARSLA